MRRTLRYLSHKGLQLIGTLLHGVLVLILFWVAIDLVHQHVTVGPGRPGLLGVALAPVQTPAPSVQVASRTHEYGYFRALEVKAKATPAPVAVAKVQPVTPKVAVKAPRVQKVAPVQMVQVTHPLPVCRKDHKGNTLWGPWCQNGSKAL